MKKTKTNALRILDQKKMQYEIYEYDVDDKNYEEHLGIKENNEENNKIYKTLLLKGNKEYLVCCLPVTKEIDLKKLAKASQNKSVEMVHQKDLLSLSGYIRGACSPIGMKKKYKTYYQQDIIHLDKVKVSAGKRGMQVILNPNDLIQITEGQLVDIIRSE